MIETTSVLFPFGSNAAFPDNGLLPMAYDSRVSQNDMARIGKNLMHQGGTFYLEEAITGPDIYTWDIDFIAMVNKSILENKIANFNKKQRVLFDAYIVLVGTGGIGVTTPEALALYIYLGGV